MTIKQFFQVAAGALIALFLYSSGLPGYVKWPGIILSFLAGIAFAFFPLEDRPLSKWLVLFLKSIYSPTIYIWQKSAIKPKFFQSESEAPQEILPLPETVPGAPAPPLIATEESQKLEKREKEFFSSVSKHFEKTIKISEKPEGIFPALEKVPTPKEKGVEFPEAIPTKIEPSDTIKEDVYFDSSYQPTSVGTQVTPLVQQKVKDVKFAKFSQEAAPPSPPTKENVVVGQVVGPEGEIVEGAILEIKDSEGRPVRALKSNKLGHFMIVTPLNNGTYQMIIEKEGFTFDSVSFAAKGEIIPPIAIWAKEKENQLAQ